MKPQILNELIQLQEAGIITAETSQKIREYLERPSPSAPNRMLLAFAILGAVMVGLGIILILAHNWDQLDRWLKSLLAFLPLLIAQCLAGYALWKKSQEVLWRESTAAFLFFTVGASLGLISQIYNIPGSVVTYTLTWMLLIFPLVYLLRSSMTSLLYIIGITYYGAEAGYWAHPPIEPYLYWLLLIGIIPHYIRLIRETPQSNFTLLHHWLIPGSVLINLGTWAQNTHDLMFIAYLTLLGLFYLIGNMEFAKNLKIKQNGYLVLGTLGTVGVLLSLSFDWFWHDLSAERLQNWWTAPEFWLSALLGILTTILLTIQKKKQGFFTTIPQEIMFLLFIPTFLVGISWPGIAQIMINFWIFSMGIFITRKGSSQDHLGILNYGLLIITALVVCRFFDTDLSFVVRGLLFVSVGVGFFLANYYLIKNRKQHV